MPILKKGPRTKSRARVFWPITLFAVVMLAGLIAAGMGLARNFDEAATQREQTVVQNGIAQRVDEIAALVLPQVVWDDAVRNLDNRFDLAWAQKNIGIYLDKSNNFHASYILNANNVSVFAYSEGQHLPGSAYESIAAGAAPLVQAVRAAETRRRESIRQEALLGAPVQASSIVSKGGDAHILTATLVQPDFASAVPSKQHAPILVTDVAIDAKFLTLFAKRFLLAGLHVHPGDSAFEPDEAHVPLRDHFGHYVATIDWLPQKPGTRLLKQAGIPGLALVLLLTCLVLYFFRRGVEVTEGLVKSEARAAHLVFHDALTGLPNRPNFIANLDKTLQQMRQNDVPFALLCIDLDRYREISETHGHKAGDEFVEEAARRLLARCRPSDVLARFEADEFGLLLKAASPEIAADLTDRLCAEMAKPMELSFGLVLAGCSVGVAMIAADDGATAAEGLRHADLALNAAKRCARGHFCLYEQEMDAIVKNRRALETDLSKALAQDRLELHYQPQVNRRGFITGVEALVRWNHAERGYISPALFIPIAERSDLILKIGMFTLRRAFFDSARWPGLKIAINVSAVQIQSENFLTRLAALVEEMNVDPRRFELEITEGVLIDDNPKTHDRLRALRDLGFELALDDFGTGYSSLSYLRRYPVNKLKIDRSFVTNLGADQTANAVVSAIVKLARALKLSVIAEGVETAQQREELAHVGCFDVQGFLFSRAVPAAEIDAICHDNGKRLDVLGT